MSIRRAFRRLHHRWVMRNPQRYGRYLLKQARRPEAAAKLMESPPAYTFKRPESDA